MPKMFCRKPSKPNTLNVTSETTVIARGKISDDWSFDGLVVITIDYLVCPEEGRPNCIRFSGKISGKESTSTPAPTLQANIDVKGQTHDATLMDAATFICNCRYDPNVGSDYEGKRVFTADKLTGEEAKTWFVRKHGEACVPLFSVHGMDNEPYGVMKAATIAQVSLDANEKKCKIVPVLWPSYGVSAYGTELRYAKEAAKELGDLYTKGLVTANVFEKKTLVCHSMGNLLLRKAADSDIKFDNIFMVAADVNPNIFGKTYINKFKPRVATAENEKYHDGLRIVRMLKDGGKIYCITHWWDLALSEVSSRWHGVYRLGNCGIGKTCERSLFSLGRLIIVTVAGGLHQEFENRYVNIEIQNPNDHHSYNWSQECIGYYREKIGLN